MIAVGLFSFLTHHLVVCRSIAIAHVGHPWNPDGPWVLKSKMNSCDGCTMLNCALLCNESGSAVWLRAASQASVGAPFIFSCLKCVLPASALYKHIMHAALCVRNVGLFFPHPPPWGLSLTCLCARGSPMEYRRALAVEKQKEQLCGSAARRSLYIHSIHTEANGFSFELFY